MWRKSFSAFLGFVFAASLSGCSGMLRGLNVAHPEKSFFGGGRVTEAGANQLFDPTFETVDLIAALDPNAKGRSTEYTEKDLEVAFQTFDENNNRESLVRRRNEIQERLLAASDQRCNLYKSYIQRLNSYTHFGLGSTATVLGGAGSIVTGAAPARLLAGLAGITSGINAEFDQDFFAQVAVHLITKGIEVRREKVYDEITKSREDAAKAAAQDVIEPSPAREKKELQHYPVEAAVKDAIRYHGGCSIAVGIEESGQAVARDKELGLKFMASTMKLIEKRNAEADKEAADAKLAAEVARKQQAEAAAAADHAELKALEEKDKLEARRRAPGRPSLPSPQ